MTARITTLPLAAALLVTMALSAQRADAATYLGSPDSSVLVAASVHATRIAGAAPPRIAVLRASGDDGVGMTVIDSAPLPVSSAAGALHEVEDLHLPVDQGDSIGFLFTAGEVDLGMRMRPRPDGAVQSFEQPCDPCGIDGGTGVELSFDAVVEPDVDGDGLGDETQDADGGGLGLDWEDDWFEDFEEGDELDEDLFEDTAPAARRHRVRTKVVVSLLPRKGSLKVLMRSARL